DVEAGDARFGAGSVERPRNEVETGDARAARDQMAASATGTARHVGDAQPRDVAERGIENGHLPFIPIAIERVAQPIAASQALVHLGLEVPVRGAVVEPVLARTISEQLDEKATAHDQALPPPEASTVSMRIAWAARFAVAATSSRPRPAA